MLQPIKKTLDSATFAMARAVSGRTIPRLMLCSLMVALAVAGFGASSAAFGQTPDSTSNSQPPATQTPASQTPTPSGQNGKPVVAAPGTVAVSAATAAALAPYTGPKYDNRWEVYGGLLFMNGQAGQAQPGRRFNMGGAEVMGTYWLGNGHGGPVSKLGIAVDGRFGAGTTPVLSPYYNRVVIMESTFMGGLQYRGPKNRYAAIDFHVLGGGAYGDFNYAVNHYPGGSPEPACSTHPNEVSLGLYCNHVAPYGTVGGSIDFNESAKLAIRLQPDMIFEHFGTETREFFAISLGAVYRFGKAK
jgi:hypothetical protein